MKLFNFEGHNIRTVDVNGNPHFVGVDVTRALMYSNPSKAVIDHCKGVTKLGIPSDGGVQETNVIPESDVYRLIVKAADQSKNETIRNNAEKFEKHVFEVILPSIRKHGAFMTTETIEKTLNNPDFIIGLATRLKEETARADAAEQERQFIQAQRDADRPLIAFAETCMDSDKNMLVREVAKLASKKGVMIGEKRLYSKLRDWGLICQSGTEPTQRGVEMGIFEVIKGVKQTPKGSRDWETTKVTPKGQTYIINKLHKGA